MERHTFDERSGQPIKLTEEQRKQLALMLEQQHPVVMGFEARYTWTLLLVVVDRLIRSLVSK